MMNTSTAAIKAYSRFTTTTPLDQRQKKNEDEDGFDECDDHDNWDDDIHVLFLMVTQVIKHTGTPMYTRKCTGTRTHVRTYICCFLQG